MVVECYNCNVGSEVLSLRLYNGKDVDKNMY